LRLWNGSQRSRKSALSWKRKTSTIPFACLIARYFDADYAVEAHSGMGMVRNYGDKKQTSEKNLYTRHTQIFDDYDSTAYDFKAYKPDIVLIQLGHQRLLTQQHSDARPVCGQL
jgi:hypothetical protein